MKTVWLMIVLLVVLTLWPGTPPNKAHAVQPSSFCSANTFTGAASCTLKVSTGQTIIAATITSCSLSVPTTFHDNQSNTYTGGATSGLIMCGGGGFSAVFMAYTVATASGHLSVSLTFAGSCICSIFAWAINLSGPFDFIGAECTGGSCSTSASTLPETTSGILVSACVGCTAGGTNFAFVAGSGGGVEYENTTSSGTPTRPTSYPYTAITSYWGDYALDTSQAQTVVPCTAFELQCWLYPMFFVGIYLSLILGMAVKGGVPQEDVKGLALEAFTISTMLAVQMGMINVMIPLLMTVVQVVRTIRA